MNSVLNRDADKTRSSEKNDLWIPGLSPERIEALTDGTFAIAMTILVLELPAPHLFGSSVPGEHPTSFLEMWSEFYIYALGFIVLGIYWILHRYIFYFIKRSDGILIWLNILFLVLASLVPFSTKVLSVNEALFATADSQWNAAGTFFTITTIASILMLFAIWQYATRGYRLVSPDIDKRIIFAINKVILVGVTINTIGVIFALFIPWASYLGFVAMVYMIFVTGNGRFRPTKA